MVGAVVEEVWGFGKKGLGGREERVVVVGGEDSEASSRRKDWNSASACSSRESGLEGAAGFEGRGGESDGASGGLEAIDGGVIEGSLSEDDVFGEELFDQSQPMLSSVGLHQRWACHLLRRYGIQSELYVKTGGFSIRNG